MALEKENQKIDLLCDWIEEQWTLIKQYPDYHNAIDLDREGTFLPELHPPQAGICKIIFGGLGG